MSRTWNVAAWQQGVYAVPTAKALGMPLVTTLHDFDVTMSKARILASQKPSRVTYTTWRNSLIDSGAAFEAVSEYVRRKAIAWGYPAERIAVPPIGVDTARITAVPLGEAPTIVHLARLVEVKGTTDLIRAFAKGRYDLHRQSGRLETPYDRLTGFHR